MGQAEIVGVPADVLAQFSKRARQIDAELAGRLDGVTTNIAKMSHRSTWRRRNREVRYYSPCPESELLSDPAVALGLSQLPMRQRSVLYLAYWLDMAPRDIAAALHISEGAAKRH